MTVEEMIKELQGRDPKMELILVDSSGDWFQVHGIGIDRTVKQIPVMTILAGNSLDDLL